MSSHDYFAEPILDDANALQDVRLHVAGKTWHLVGRGGPAREKNLLRPWLETGHGLPVLLGSGLGCALETLLQSHSGPVAVVDKEAAILGHTGLKERFADSSNLLWVDDSDSSQALSRLSQWQMQNQGLPLVPVTNPVYLRLDPDYYAWLREQLTASKAFDFWAKARYPKFKDKVPRILLISSSYFLMGEVVTACQRLGLAHHFINFDNEELGSSEFVESLLTAVIEFKPDFLLTINHLGVDREGVLVDLLERLELPLASWFVDNPHLILYLYNKNVSPMTHLFTWDADNVPSLKSMGFDHVQYLPLATDSKRFVPAKTTGNRWPVSFVGNSMRYKVGHRLKVCQPDKVLLRRYKEMAAVFSQDPEPSVQRFLEDKYPELVPSFQALGSNERRLALETMLTWEATRQYRQSCVEKLLPFEPLIAGDKGWTLSFKNTPHTWHWQKEMNYYSDLPTFYPRCDINFNCTSKQMKGAVNQRVFDVPATESFLLTDWREQMDQLFHPGKEVVFFLDPEEISELVRHYLKHPAERQTVARAARKRVRAEHTYEHRLRSIVNAMRAAFA